MINIMERMTFSEVISIILGIGAIASAVAIPFFFWKMKDYFVTKEAFIAFQEEQKGKHQENRSILEKIDRSIHDINTDIKMILKEGVFKSDEKK